MVNVTIQLAPERANALLHELQVIRAEDRSVGLQDFMMELNEAIEYYNLLSQAHEYFRANRDDQVFVGSIGLG